MPTILVVTHGHVADELLAAAAAIEPSLKDSIQAVSLPWEIDSDVGHRMIEERIAAVADGGVLLLTDMFGGTATNLALPFADPGRIEIVTGVNLPMLIKVASLIERDLPLDDFAERITDAARKSIRVASEFLRTRRGRHARAAAKLVHCANRFDSTVSISAGDEMVNAKSILGLLTLAATAGTEVEVTTEGHDEELAADAVVELFEGKFGEGE